MNKKKRRVLNSNVGAWEAIGAGIGAALFFCDSGASLDRSGCCIGSSTWKL